MRGPRTRGVIVNRDGQTLSQYRGIKNAPRILTPSDIKKCCKEDPIFRDALQEILRQ